MQRLFFLTMLIGAFVSATPAVAQTKIAIIDVALLLTQSEAAKSVHKQRQDMQSKFLNEISKTEQGLRQKEQALLAQRENITKEEFAQKKKEYEKDLLETGKMVRKKKQALEKSYSDAMDQLKNKVTTIARDLAKEKEFDLVLTNQNVIVGASALDLTQEAMQRLNQELKNIKLTKE